MEKENSSSESTKFLPILLAVMMTASLVGGIVFYWQRQELKKAKEEIKQELAEERVPLLTPTPTVIPISSVGASLSPGTPTVTDEYAGWLTYTNDVYGYQFKYPAGATIEEVLQEAFSLSPEEVAAGMTFEEKFLEYTGKICISLNYNLAYVQISAPANSGFSHVICGRTGRAYEGPDRSEALTIDGGTYTASGFEEQGPGETLDLHNETLVVTLDDGTRIEYGSQPVSTATFADYLAARGQLIKIVESYQKI